jgi:hypothetical protein
MRASVMIFGLGLYFKIKNSPIERIIKAPKLKSIIRNIFFAIADYLDLIKTQKEIADSSNHRRNFFSGIKLV